MKPSYTRLVGAVVAVMIGLVILWQAGILFTKDDTGPLDLQSADVSIETPATAGFDVGLKPGDLAPDFEFSSIDGDRLRLSDFRGRPVLVNFWATWCLPCRSEMPAIDAALQRYAGDHVAVLAVNRGESYTAIKDWVDEQGIDFTAYGYDPDESVFNRYQGLGMPTSFFIDARGVVTEVFAGPLSDSDLDSALQDTIAGYGAKSN